MIHVDRTPGTVLVTDRPAKAPTPPGPSRWTYVWETTEGPSLGAVYRTSEEAYEALFEEWQGFNDGGVEDDPRAIFDALYEESSEYWVVPLQ